MEGKEDFDLDEILESALEDFEADEREEQKKEKQESVEPQVEPLPTPPAPSLGGEEDEELDEVKLEEVRKLMEGLSHGDFDTALGEIMQSLDSEGGDLPPELTDLLKNDEAMKKLSQDLEGTPEMEGIMANMMNQLMAKDVMYKPMCEMREKYPEWLQANKEKLPAEEFARFQKHSEYIERICKVYEQEPDNLNKIVELMQEMQEVGQPPDEMLNGLLKDMDVEDPEQFLPELQKNLESDKNCCVM